MKLGLLNSYTPDNEATRSINCYESFQKYFADYSNEIKIENYQLSQGDFPATPNECDAYLLSGSAKSVYEEIDWLERLKTLVKEIAKTDIKMVGICFGHQILAHSLGGETRKSENGWALGPQKFIVQTDAPSWMNPEIKEPSFYFSNQDQVLELPTGATLIAGNEQCPNGMYSIGNQIFGMQFHPEFTQEMMLERIDKFLYSTDYEWLSKVREDTKSVYPDSEDALQWILNFLEVNQSED